MPYVTYRGDNASLTLYGIRFRPRVPVLVEKGEVVKKLQERADFTVQEEKVIPLKDLTLPQLKDKAKAAKIEGFSSMDKPELIKALEVKANANTDNPPTA